MSLARFFAPAIAFVAVAISSVAFAAPAAPLVTDLNAGASAIGTGSAFNFGGYGLDTGAQYAVFSQGTLGPCCHGAGFSVNISNGENGIDQSFDGGMNQDLNLDVPNTAPASPAFAAIGNPSGKLENGNVLRFSAWFRADPNNPISIDPQVQPVLKFEIWKEALSGNQDTNGGQLNPSFGDKVFDQDQHGNPLQIPVADRVQLIDFGGAPNDAAAAAQGRVSTLTTGAWTLVETSYTVNDDDWFGIDTDVYGVELIEEIRGVMFVGDFTGNTLADDGNFLVDNVLVEVFRNSAAVTANPNPRPPLSLLAGDFNDDGSVNAADYTVYRDGLGQVDALGAGFIESDFDIWAGNYGAGAAGSGTAAAVPEGVSIGLVAAGLLAGAVTRRVAR